MRRSVALASLILIHAFAHAARAESVPEVALVTAGARASELAAALAERGHLPVALRLASLPNVPSSSAASERERKALEAIASARKAYVGADFDACLRALGDDASVTQLLADGLTQAAARTLLYRVSCQVGRGASAEAEAAALAFGVLELPVPEDVSRIAQDAEAQLSQALRSAGQATRIVLQVASTPAARRVEIDGRDAGCTSPCTLQLLPGDHVLRLSGDDSEPLVTRVHLARGEEQQRAFTLEPATPSLAAEQWSARYAHGEDAESAASLRLLARALPADKLLLLYVTPMHAQAFALHGSYAIGGELTARDGMDAVGESQLASRAEQLLENLLVRGKTVAAPRPVWKSGWFWAAVGTVAVAAALGTGFAVRPEKERTEVRFQ